MLTHANLASNALQVEAIDPRQGERDVILGVLPMFHVFANTCVLNRTVANGGCIAMLPRFEAGQALKTLARVGATAFPGVPTMYQALLDHPGLAKTDFSSLRVCISGGAPLPAPVREAWEDETGARLVEGYGLTESSGVVSTNPYEGGASPARSARSCRTPGSRCSTRKTPPGRRPKASRANWSWRARRSCRATGTGPTPRRTPSPSSTASAGCAPATSPRSMPTASSRIVDRIKDMIAVGGFKVFPSQVEAVLLEHPAVKEALVLGLPDAYHGEMPRAFVTLSDDADSDRRRAAKWLNARVGKHERVERGRDPRCTAQDDDRQARPQGAQGRSGSEPA